MNKYYSKLVFILSVFLLTSCSYKPIFSEKNYNFEINEIKYSGEKQINNSIKNKINLIKKNESQNKKRYDLSINSYKEKLIVSKDSIDPLKFELIVTTDYKVNYNNMLLLNKTISKIISIITIQINSNLSKMKDYSKKFNSKTVK